MASESGRPQRKRVKKLTDEEIHAILQSESESSDVDDPDFVNEDFFESTKSPETKKRVQKEIPAFEEACVVPPKPQLLEDQKSLVVLKPSSTPVKAPAAPAKDSKGPCYRCCVTGCISGNLSDKDGLWLFPLPASSATLSAWEAQLPIDAERNRPLSPRVCFRHFDKADFIRKQQRFVGLCEGAVPKTAANTAKPPSQPKQRRVEPTSVSLQPRPQVVRLMPITSQLGTPGHPGLPGFPTVPPNPAFPRPVPQTLRPAAFVPEESVTNGTILPDAPMIIPRNSTVASQGKDRFGTADPASDDALELMEIKIEPIEQLPEDEGADGQLYALTLEDIQEELPWVMPDNSWKSDMEGHVLVISKDADGRTGVIKKVVIEDGLGVTVYVGDKKVEEFDGATLASADDLRIILEQVEKVQ